MSDTEAPKAQGPKVYIKSLRTPVYSSSECTARVRDMIAEKAKSSDAPLGTALPRWMRLGLCSAGAQIRWEELVKRDAVECSYSALYGKRLTAMHYSLCWAWYFTQSVCEADPEFAAELLKSTFNGRGTLVRRDIFRRLIGQPLFIPTDNKTSRHDALPQEEWQRTRRRGDFELGLLVGAHTAADGSLTVSVSCVTGTGFFIPFTLVRFEKGEEVLTIGECFERGEAPEMPPEAGNIGNHILSSSLTALALTLYALCDSEEAAAFRSARYIPVPRPAKTGEKLYPPSRPHIHAFGKAVGDAIREYERREKTEAAGDGTRTVRPHIRSAHWHSYWYGPRESEKRECRLVWVAPVFVNSRDVQPE